MIDIDLNSTTDAVVWADEWLRITAIEPAIPTNKECMVSWFANAIMTGYDAGRRAEERELARQEADAAVKAMREADLL